MSKFLNLAKIAFQGKNIKFLKSEKNLMLCRYFLIAITLILFIGNIIKINYNATRGYAINQLQNKSVDLQNQQKFFKLEVANYKSLQSIEERVKKLGFVPTGKINYLMGDKNVVVAKK